MNKFLLKNDQVSICHKDNCIQANGKNAEMIAKGATIMLLFFGIAAIVRAVSK
ncbi:hypothetical protein [Fluviicola taffensis]|uniref:Uncharacterized protein n=1 Tax=Fluviicola taffensis (strain DSM 16823 / NCIMB 13979 / RW262) TaxID=755732 RepID=F2IJ98_FLUTR|nr:hypothetical protein [Fluviicola taffensis]AEA44968.1 hypothetical protein Fluta_2989 [Fluviicola taffensis DSM 16823]